MLIENTLFGTVDKVAQAIQRIKLYEQKGKSNGVWGGVLRGIQRRERQRCPA